MPTIARPERTEYAAYYQRYVDHVPEGDIVELLEQQLGDTVTLLGGISEEKANHRYAEGKWSIKESVAHVIDAERVFAYRALTFARGDRGPLPGFDQDGFAANAAADARTLRDLAGEYVHVRRGNLHMLRSLTEEAWTRGGIASDNPVTVRGLAYIILGHELHHVKILREKYL